jgi:hypothetical protein
MATHTKPPGETASWWRRHCAARAQRRRFNLSFCASLPFERVWSNLSGRRYYWRHDGRPLFGWACLEDRFWPDDAMPWCPAVARLTVNGPPLPMSEQVNDYLKAFSVGHGRRAVRGGGMTTEGLPCGPPFLLDCLYEELEAWAPKLAAIVARGGTGRHQTPAAAKAIEEWLEVAERLTPQETLFRDGRLRMTVGHYQEKQAAYQAAYRRRKRERQVEAACAPLRAQVFAQVRALLDAADEREGLPGGDSRTSREDP